MRKFAGLLPRTGTSPVIHCLDVYSPGRRPYAVPLVDMCTRIGTGPGASVQLDDPLLDRVHCQIIYVRDYDDCEDTYIAIAAGRHRLIVNNIAMRRRQLRPNDRIRIGATELVYRLHKPASSGPLRSDAPQPLISAAQTLLEASALETALEALLDAFVVLTRAEHAFLVMFVRGQPQIHLARNDCRDTLGNSALQFSDSIVQTAVQSRQPLLIQDLRASPYRTAASVVRLGLRSVLCIPLPEAEHVMGVLYAGAHAVQAPTPECVGLAQVLAALAMLRVRNALLSGEMHLQLSDPPATVEPGGEPNGVDAAQGSPLVGRSLGEIRRTIERLAPLRVPVLIHGEPGTGKTLIAGELHRRSGRTGPVCWLSARVLDLHRAFWSWLILQVANLPETTLVLEDIERLSPGLHEPLRELVLAHPRLRLVTTTTTAPEMLAAHLGPQLAAVIADASIYLPPLVDRGTTDVLDLAEHFRVQARGTSMLACDFAPDAVCALKTYPWPGNVLELRQSIYHAVGQCADVLIGAAGLGLREAPEVVPLRVAQREFVARHVQKTLVQMNGDPKEAARRLEIGERSVYRHIKALHGGSNP